MKPRYACLIVGFLLTSLSATLPAWCHPLGSFSIDHYSRLRVTPEVLWLRYIIDMAEIPTLQEMLQLDADGDQDISVVERRVYLERKVSELAGRLGASLNGTRLHWRIESSDLRAPPNRNPSGGPVPPTFRIVVDMRAEFPAPLAKQNTVLYEDQNYPERTGWKEIIVDPEPGVRVLRSSASTVDLSHELTRYPPQVPVPPQDVAARFTFETIAEAGFVGRVRNLGALQPYFWLMLAIVALSILVRWRLSQKPAH